MKNLQGIGLPFFPAEEWSAAKTVMEDAHTFHDTYAEFVAAIEQGERRLRGQGQATIRVNLRMAEFIPWCKANGCKINAEGRAKFAAIKAAQADRGG
jgi:hypothetical protein